MKLIYKQVVVSYLEIFMCYKNIRVNLGQQHKFCFCTTFLLVNYCTCKHLSECLREYEQQVYYNGK